jgi:hypothetical protein
MSWGALAGMALGAVQNYAATQSYIEQLGYETAQKIGGITATKEAYQADVDAFIVQDYINKELASNAVTEALRAGGATAREAQVQVKKGASTISAASEGITGGASAARRLTSFYSQASKEVGKEMDETRRQVIQIADAADKARNDIATRAEQSYNNMRMALAGVSSYSSLQAPSIGDTLNSLAQGASTGYGLEQNYNTITRAAKAKAAITT